MDNLPYDINDIKRLCKSDTLIWTRHALKRLQQRKILQCEVEECIHSGEIIEAYFEDKPFPSCLVFGITSDSRILHTVCSINGDFLYIISAYQPTTDKWNADYKTRKRVGK